MRTFIFCSLVLTMLASRMLGQDGIDVADGLTIVQVADDDLVPDCTTVTVDPRGRVVASGPGYIRLLMDKDDNGVFDQFETLLDRPSHGAHGLCFDGRALYFVGDDGVWKVTDPDADDPVDTQPVRVLEIKTGGEHHAHAVRKGPDGFWYLIAGNGIKEMYSLSNEPQPLVANPRAGAIWRISPDWSQRQVWAHGFRNAYDFDFAPDHAIDTFDSDGERDVSLPWYRPTRVYRVRQGNDAGWVTRSWKRPNVDPQMPRVLAELGRGSPTGVLRNRHTRLPSRFHQGLFVLDWTFGRIVFVGDDGRVEVIASPKGTTGFAVTDIDAFPDGRLVVSVGGRRSRGGLYLIDAAEPNEVPKRPSRLWTEPQEERPSDVTRDWITKLRNQTDRQIDRQAASHAVALLCNEGATARDWIDAITLLIESVGGLGQGDPKDARGKQQAAAVFDSYRSLLRPKLEEETIQQATDALIRMLKSTATHKTLATEVVRAIAVLEPESKEALVAIADDMDRVESPVDKLHRLIALARIPVGRSDEMTDRIAHAMLNVPVLVDEEGMQIDRNWTPRLGELYVAMEHRDSLLPSRMVSLPPFGHPSHLVWTERMDPENLERARQKCLQRYADRKIDPTVARFIAMGNDAIPPRVAYQWLKDPLTRPAGWLELSKHPRPKDVDQLRAAALSVDKVVREAAEDGLRKLGAEIPQRVPTTESIRQWLGKAEAILSLEGDVARGKVIFQLQRCATCHDGAKALGPSLAGVAKRFSRRDFFRATVDPSHTVSDRYRARQVVTLDGRVVVGMPIYESVDGLTLLTAEAKTQRINSDAIDQVVTMSTSLMPEGLIDGLTDTQVADLLAYMQSL